jgi:hypothetical protein
MGQGKDDAIVLWVVDNRMALSCARPDGSNDGKEASDAFGVHSASLKAIQRSKGNKVPSASELQRCAHAIRSLARCRKGRARKG